MRRKGQRLVIFGLLALQVLVPKQLAHVSCSANMEWGFKETRLAVTVLHKCGKSDSQIFELLKPLKISQNFAYRAIKRCKELWCVEDRARSESPRCVRTKVAIKTVRERIRWNPLRKQNSLVRELNIDRCHASSETIYTWEHTSAQRDTSLLPLWRTSDRQEQSVSSSDTPRTGTKHPLHGQENLHHRGAVQLPERQDLCSNIVWGEGEGSKGAERKSSFLRHGFVGVSHQRLTTLHFCDKGVKTGARVYHENVLQGVLKPLNATLFNCQKWVFQQDSASTHTAKTTKEWMRRQVPSFISAEDWPSGNPDLNPLDYKLWAVLEHKACQKRHKNLDSLERSHVKAAA